MSQYLTSSQLSDIQLRLEWTNPVGFDAMPLVHAISAVTNAIEDACLTHGELSADELSAIRTKHCEGVKGIEDNLEYVRSLCQEAHDDIIEAIRLGEDELAASDSADSAASADSDSAASDSAEGVDPWGEAETLGIAEVLAKTLRGEF